MSGAHQRPRMVAPSRASSSTRPAAVEVPSSRRISAPRPAAARRCGPSASSRVITRRSCAGFAFLATSSPGAGCRDRGPDHRLVQKRMHRHHHQWEVVRQGAHRRGVATVADHQRDLRHQLVVGDVAMDLVVGGRLQGGWVDGGTGGDHHACLEVGGGVQDPLERGGHPGEHAGAEADQDRRLVGVEVVGRRGIDGRAGEPQVGRERTVAGGIERGQRRRQAQGRGVPAPDRIQAAQPPRDAHGPWSQLRRR